MEKNNRAKKKKDSRAEKEKTEISADRVLVRKLPHLPWRGATIDLKLLLLKVNSAVALAVLAEVVPVTTSQKLGLCLFISLS